jgi:hypothetical protein
MSWGWLLIAAWLGFIAGYVLCGMLSWDQGDLDD